MRVLWFTNTSANSDEYFNNQLKGSGGWLKALDKELQDKVDLYIAFYHKEDILPFKYGNTHYYPIFKGKKSLIQKFIDSKVLKIILREDVEKYLAIINEIKPDIIHIHGTENPFGYIIEKTNIPIVISLQGILNIIHHKYFGDIEYRYIHKSRNLIEKLVGYKPLKNSYNKTKKMMYREADIIPKCKHFIGRTNFDRRITKLLAPNATYTHSDEILRDGFYVNKWEMLRTDKFIISTTSSPVPYKGLETICYAISLLNKSGIINFEWRITGISEQDFIVKIVKRKLGKHYPRKSLVFLGRLPEINLINNLLQSDVYVMPSHIENSPNNLSEAMILGLPCIATFAGGTGSLLKDGEEGVLIQDGDQWAMAGAIIEFYNNPKSSIKFGENARIRALRRQNKELIVTDLVDTYKSII